MLYFDCAATTPPYDEVVDTVAEVMRKHYGNPSSLHRLGVDAEALIERSRQAIGQTIGVSAADILFTGSGTESNNLAIFGALRRNGNVGRHIITTAIEHASVYETFQRLETEGFRVTYVPVDETGQIRLDALEASLSEDTALVSVMYVNNEMGRIQPVAQIGQLLRSYPKALFHVDAVQAYGKLAVRPKELGIDLMSCSAHKLRGPKGIGFLYCRSGLELEPLLLGGGQERGVRSGTENVPAIVGMAKAARLAAERREAFLERTGMLRRILIQGIGQIPELQINGSKHEEDMASHIVHFSYPGMKSEVVVHALEQHGVFVSSRSACSSRETVPSRVLTAMGCDREHAISGLRISYGLEHSVQDAEMLLSALKRVVMQLSGTTGQRNRRR